MTGPVRTDADPRVAGLPAWLVATLAGLAFGIRWLVGVPGPAYWEPTTPLDLAAVVTWSLALVALAPGALLLVELAGRPRWVVATGRAVAAAALVAAGANLLGDAFDLALGTVYVAAVLVAVAALLGLALALALARARWRLWVVVLATFLGLLATEVGGSCSRRAPGSRSAG